MKSFYCSLLFVVLTGCATSGTNPDDPYEDYNRAVYKFNRGLDKAVLQPVAKGYQAVTPDPVEKGFSNFFDNIGDVGNMINNALQFKLGDAASDLGRILINSTLGLAGFFDPASAMGLDKNDEDFGQTLATWGVDAGPYVMLPFLGPSTLRDTFAMPGDNYFDPFTEVKPERDEYALKGFRLLITRAELLELESQLESAIDEYAFVRDAYLQNRKFKVYDGNLPLDDVFECDPEYEDC